MLLAKVTRKGTENEDDREEKDVLKLNLLFVTMSIRNMSMVYV